MQNIPTFINQRNGTNLASANMKKYKKNKLSTLVIKKKCKLCKTKSCDLKIFDFKILRNFTSTKS